MVSLIFEILNFLIDGLQSLEKLLVRGGRGARLGTHGAIVALEIHKEAEQARDGLWQLIGLLVEMR